MVKKTLLLAIILIPLMLMAQAEPFPETTETGYGMSGSVGYVSFGSVTYTQLRLMPEISFWKFGFGLDIDLLIDADGNIRKDDWDETLDLIYKIYYIRFAQRGDMIYGRVGGFPSHTLGQGLIMKNYSNMLLYPDKRNVGALAGFNLPLPMNPGGEIFTSNIEKNLILAANAHFQPLVDSEIPVFADMVIGASAVTDRNQYGKFDDKDKDKVPDILDPNPKLKNFIYDFDGDGIFNNVDIDMDGDGILDSPWVNDYVAEIYPTLSDSVLAALLDNQIDQPRFYGDKRDIIIYSLNYEFPLLQTTGFTLGHYAEYAQIKDYGSGFIFPGLYSAFLMFDLNLEFRKFYEQFLPAYFDRLYEEQRAYINGNEILTKDATLIDVNEAYGWYGSLETNIFNMVILQTAFQDMYGKDLTTGKSIWARIGIVPMVVPKIKEINIGYSQTNVPYISIDKLRTPSAEIDGKVSYSLSDNTFLVGKYSERYVDLDGNNKIEGKDEVLKFMSIGVEFSF